MCGGLILSCCPCNHHGHERALKEEEEDIFFLQIFKNFIFLISVIDSGRVLKQ